MCFHHAPGEPVEVWLRWACFYRPDPQCSCQLAVASQWSQPSSGQGQWLVRTHSYDLKNNNNYNGYKCWKLMQNEKIIRVIIIWEYIFKSRSMILVYEFGMYLFVPLGMQVRHAHMCSSRRLRTDLCHVPESSSWGEGSALWRVH